MVTATIPRTLPETYFDLVKQFPLTHLRDADHLREALSMLDRLLERDLDLDVGAREYLDALTDHVEIYEDKHVAMSDASEADVLRELMGTNRLTQQELSKQVGISQSTISAILKGTRTLTRSHMIVLSRFFHVSPSIFLPK